jgi:hydrogenase maturation protease
LTPETLKIVEGDEVPKFADAIKNELASDRLSGSIERLSLPGAYPEKLALVGRQPLVLEDWAGR